MSAEKPYWVTSPPEQLAQRLVDNVSCATQLDVEKGELANVEDWRRNAEAMFKLIIRDRCATEAAEAARSQLAVAVDALDRVEGMCEVPGTCSGCGRPNGIPAVQQCARGALEKLRAAKEGR